MKTFDPNLKQQYQIPGHHFVADFFLPSKNLIVEINGPTHYIKKIVDGRVIVTDELNGRTRAKENRVRDEGLNIVSINFTFFNQSKSEAEIEQGLREKLGN